jgi:hypothetical protein
MDENQDTGSGINIPGPQHCEKNRYLLVHTTGTAVTIGSKKKSSAVNSVLRIRDVYPGSDFFPSRNPDPGSELSPSRIPDPGSASKNLSILTPKKNKKMVSKL